MPNHRRFRVFPITQGKKAPPLISDWPRNASADPEQIATWAEQFPGCNWGIHCEDLLVLDVDVKGDKPGMDTLSAISVENDLPDTLEAETPSGGRHIFYRHQGGVHNGVNVFPGIDVRSNNGYVVAAGSTTSAGGYWWTSESPIADAPTWLVDRCQATERPSEAAVEAEGVDADNAVRRATEALRGTQPAIEGQGGDAHTYAVVCRVRDFGVPQDRAVEALEAWNARCEPPWLADDLRRKVANAYQYGQNAPGSRSLEAIAAEFDLVLEAPSREGDGRLLRVGDVKPAKVWPCDYLVKDWLGQGADALLFGEFGRGKTFVCLDLAAHIATGVTWFGLRTRQGGVLYLLYEGHSGLTRRLTALRQAKPDLPWDSIPFAVMTIDTPLVDLRTDNQNELPGRRQLQDAIKSFAEWYGVPPALLVVDTYSRAIAGSASDEELAGRFSAMAGALRRTYGMTTLRIHHPGHGQKDRARGAYAITAGLDTEIRVEDGVIVTTKERDSEAAKLGFKLEVVTLGHDQDGDPVTSCVVNQVPLENSLALSVGEEKALSVILEVEGATGDARVSRRDVLNALREAGIVGEGKPGQRAAAELYEGLVRKEAIKLTSTHVQTLARGVAALFEDNQHANS